ncbi:hypothetical protein DPMN_034008 [Dreissena polymorpha]|uniref:Uncharacterized protein n=1 Tax=Dreissena polymorpha TaxID=45954 RepID=A0A9D4M5Y8_DREPO|nr:hypothetical protein DPMN_034008 [Dreissena polymorpha]
MAWQRPTREPHVEIDRIVIRVQYQLEVNRCRNKEIIVKNNVGWVWPIMGGAPQVEIDLIVLRDVQFQFEVNQCRNEEIIVKGNFRWVCGHGLCGRGAPGLVMGPCIAEIDRIVIREAILGGRGLCGQGALGLVMGPCLAEIDHIVIMFTI